MSTPQMPDVEGAEVREPVGDERAGGWYDEAREPFEQVALADDLTEFLTLPTYERIA